VAKQFYGQGCPLPCLAALPPRSALSGCKNFQQLFATRLDHCQRSNWLDFCSAIQMTFHYCFFCLELQLQIKVWTSE
jgi:hypothetical protein